MMNHRNACQIAVPNGARIQDPSFTPGHPTVTGGGFEPNFRLPLQDRRPSNLTRSRFHVDQRFPLHHPHAGGRHRLARQKRHRSDYGAARRSHPAHPGGNLPGQAQRELPFHLEKGRQGGTDPSPGGIPSLACRVN